MHLCVSSDGSAEVGIGIPTAPPRSELGFHLPRSAALDADVTSAREH